MAVNNTHPQYDDMVPEWTMMTDVCSSERHMHLRGEAYIPRLKGQNDDKYDAYLNRAAFVMFTKRAVEAFHGMVMRKDVHVEGHDSINVDGEGSTINNYVSKIVLDYLKYGRGGTLIDMPVVNEPMTIADEIENNIFPRMLYYSCSNIINWKTKIINNVKVLSMVVLRESVNTSEDEFSHDVQYTYRVLDLVEEGGKHVYRQRKYDHNYNQEGADIYPLRKNVKIPFIPFYFHGGIDVKFPPLLPIAEQNKHHYMLDADYKHGLHMVALPTPWVSGIDKANAPTEIGPTALWVLEDENAKCGMLEFTGQGLAAIEKAMGNIVEIIVTLASRVIAPQKSSNDESALAAAIRNNSETSTLASIVDQLSSDISNALRTVAWWAGKDPSKIAVAINKDFMPNMMSGTDVLAYITGWIKGGISYESLFQILKKGEIVKGDRNLVDELNDITKEQRERAMADLEKAEKTAAIDGGSNDDPSKNLDPEKKVEIDKRVVQ